MIIFAIFNLLVWLYALDKSDVDTVRPLFAFLSFIEMSAVIVAIAVWFREIVGFIKWMMGLGK